MNQTKQDASDTFAQHFDSIARLKESSDEYLMAMSEGLALWLRQVDAELAARRGQVIGPTLSPRERAVLNALDSDRTYEEVATLLNMSINTVRHHVRGIYRKLGVSNRHAAVTKFSTRV